MAKEICIDCNYCVSQEDKKGIFFKCLKTKKKIENPFCVCKNDKHNIEGTMFKELIYDLVWKSLEIVFYVIIGYFIFVLLEDAFATLWAMVCNTILHQR